MKNKTNTSSKELNIYRSRPKMFINIETYMHKKKLNLIIIYQ